MKVNEKFTHNWAFFEEEEKEMNKSERCIKLPCTMKFNLAHEILGQILSGLPSLSRVAPLHPSGRW